MIEFNRFNVSLLFTTLFMTYTPMTQADMQQQDYDYQSAYTPIVGADDSRQQSSYGEKVGNKALNAFANLTTSTLEMPKNIINTMNQSNFFRKKFLDIVFENCVSLSTAYFHYAPWFCGNSFYFL